MHNTNGTSSMIPQLRHLEVTDLDPGTIPNGALLSIGRSLYHGPTAGDLHAIFLGYGTEQKVLASGFAETSATVLIGEREMTLCHFNDGRGHPWSLWDNALDRSFGAFARVIYHLEEPVRFCDHDTLGATDV